MRHFIYLLLIIGIGIIIYSNTFNASFHFDDTRFIIENPFIKDFGYFLESESVDLKAESDNLSPDVKNYFRTRMVGFFSFWTNYRLGGLDVRGYHAANLAIHIINAMLVYLIVAITFKTPMLVGSPMKVRSEHIALFSGLLFVAHPMQTEAVTYVLQRLVVLAAMFYLLSTVSYIGARLSEKKSCKCGLYAVALISAVLGMKTKENVFTLPLAIALYEFMFFRSTFKRRVLYLAPLLLTMLIIPLAYTGLNTGAGGTGAVLDGATRLDQEVSRWDYMYTQFEVVAKYIGLLLLPVKQNVDHGHILYHSFFEPAVFMSFLFLLGIFVLGIYLLYSSRITDYGLRIAAFGIFWFFLALSVESSVLPIGESMVEYRVYLPSAGFLAAGVVLFFTFFRMRRPYANKAILPLLFLAVVVLSAAAHARNTVWQSEVKLWEDSVRKSPENARAHVNLGLAYSEVSLQEKSIEHYLIALENDPEHVHAEAHNNLGVLYSSKGMFDKAIKHLWAALKFKPDHAEAHSNLGIIYDKQGRHEESVKEYLTALRIAPESAEIHNNLGIVYGKMGRHEEAEHEYRVAFGIRPDYAEAHNNLGVTYFNTGRLDEAIREYKTALGIKPDYEDAKHNLELAYETIIRKSRISNQ
jgi:tetratricopeptide (TPR) repeat protein